MTKTVWLYRITYGPHLVVSPLEKRLKNSGIAWTPSWQFVNETHRNIFGQVTYRGCGLAPPIYELDPALEDFATTATDAELREFVRVMQSGTDTQRKAAVEAALDKVKEDRSHVQAGG